MTFSTSLTSLAGTGGHPTDDDWMGELDVLDKRDTYHLPGYQRLTSPTGYEVIFCSFRSAGWTVGLPLTLRPLPDPVRKATGFAYDASSVYGYPGPLLTRCASTSAEGTGGNAGAGAGVDGDADGDAADVPDAAWRAEFSQAVADVCAKLGVLTAFIRNHPLYGASELFDGPAYAVGATTPTVAIDLRPRRDERLARASAHHRRALRKSEAHGLRCEQDHSPAAVVAFTTCYAETMARVAASAAYLLDAEQVNRMLAELGPHAELWVARKRDGEVASAAIFLRTDGIWQYHLGGTRAADYPLGAARPLFETAAEVGHQRGDRWLHLGGGVGGDNDSLLRYKGGFGPDRFSFCTIRAVFDEQAYAAATRAVGLDPAGGFFPAYRTSALGILAP